jgi:rare lipoprotein A
MNAGALAAAHRSLPFGTRVRVDNLGNGRSVVVRINDRGPFVRGRVIDVTRGAAAALGMLGSGTASVRLTVVDGGKPLLGCS